MFKERNIAVAIILTIITFGIYGLYWMAALSNESSRYLSKESSGGLEVLFTLITCGIYGIYWNYKMGKKLYGVQAKTSTSPSDDSILYLLLSIFGLSIISLAIMQSKVNDLGSSNSQF
ncbi:DUF4234 domain-containing protein [Clostridium cellulovorans]|uniref:DUF4234 domain-containing protein n=1 Tax=Clostridium cellulovorans (strain ATCC 35296 / DSM 3052 / OCM 3 / 743B) TaxID=573061 RepID=D9SKZ1_CLOC7|nr:DUF4234 domain-containing protein [Clostridium cellulovorans]ADL53563.1 hypothetical protein Clocel_3897 [Clostridium cellulovorans 743B]